MDYFLRIILVSVIAALAGGCSGSATVRDAGGETIEYHPTPFNAHCRNPLFARELRSLGPLYAIGASVSHGLFSTSFPDWIRDQMCLSADAFEDDYFFLFFLKSDRRILSHLSELRPRLIVAMDFPYHYVKMQYADEARETLRHYLTMLLMDCRNPSIDCSEGGEFHFVAREKFQPVVLTGTLYFDCAEDLRVDPNLKSFPSLEVCREENIKLNRYLRQMADEYPNLYVLPVYEMVMALHDSGAGVYRYAVDGVTADFTKGDLFVDGFHPWTDPGTYVLANLVIEGINRLVIAEKKRISRQIPYIPLELD